MSISRTRSAGGSFPTGSVPPAQSATMNCARSDRPQAISTSIHPAASVPSGHSLRHKFGGVQKGGVLTSRRALPCKCDATGAPAEPAAAAAAASMHHGGDKAKPAAAASSRGCTLPTCSLLPVGCVCGWHLQIFREPTAVCCTYLIKQRQWRRRAPGRAASGDRRDRLIKIMDVRHEKLLNRPQIQVNTGQLHVIRQFHCPLESLTKQQL